MSLHCPATLLIARHGDAEYGHAPVLSDEGGWLTEKGEAQVRALADRLRSQAVGRVFSSPMERAVRSGEIAAQALEVSRVVLDGLQEIEVGAMAGRAFADPQWHAVLDAWMGGDLAARVPEGPSGEEVLARYREALQTIADQHRGETVLVFSHGGAMSICLPQLAVNTRGDFARERYLPNAVPARFEISDDGWYLYDWPGSADRSVV